MYIQYLLKEKKLYSFELLNSTQIFVKFYTLITKVFSKKIFFEDFYLEKFSKFF